MNKKDIEYFSNFFSNKKEEILKRSANRANDTTDYGGDEADIVQMNTIKNLSDQLGYRERDIIYSIDLCIAKLANHSYGICEECEEKIAIARLRALPYTILCISCAEAQEIS